MSCFYRINASDKNNKVKQSPILTEDQFKYLLLYSQASSTKNLLQFSSKSLYSLVDEQKINIEKAKERVIAYVKDLLVLTDGEKEFLSKLKEKVYEPELLFDNEEIVANIKNHPAALWRTKGNN